MEEVVEQVPFHLWKEIGKTAALTAASTFGMMVGITLFMMAYGKTEEALSKRFSKKSV